MTPILAPPSLYEAAHRAYRDHVTTTCRGACATGGLCQTGYDLLRRADALSWRDMGRGGR